MFSYEETPFRPKEVRQILRLTQNEFTQALCMHSLTRSVECHFRCDDSFNYSNYFDILSFRLRHLEYEKVIAAEDGFDIVFDFIDRMASCLDRMSSVYPEVVGETVYRVSQAMRNDPFGEELREFSGFGEYLLCSEDLVVRTDQREDYLCAIAVAILHRALPVLYSSSMKRATADNVILVDPEIAVCQGKLCSYFPVDLLAGTDDEA